MLSRFTSLNAFKRRSPYLRRGSLLSLKLLLFHLIGYCLCHCIRFLFDEPEWCIYIIVVDLNFPQKSKQLFTYLPPENSSYFLPPQLQPQTSPPVMRATAPVSEQGIDKTYFLVMMFKPLTMGVIPRSFLLGI